jgi:hypothetical protein
MHYSIKLQFPGDVMKKLVLLIFFICLSFNQVFASESKEFVQLSRAASKALGGELKKQLQVAMKKDGPVNGLTVCSENAQKISKKISKDKGMSVGRTSLKYRNEANEPDDWETSILKQFEQRKASGESAVTLEYSEKTEINGEKVLRYMKAIPTDDVCLTCHGSNIAEPVAAKLQELYPNDKATGFKKGDIRGAFTIIKSVKE